MLLKDKGEFAKKAALRKILNPLPACIPGSLTTKLKRIVQKQPFS